MKKIVTVIIVVLSVLCGTNTAKAVDLSFSYGGFTAMDAMSYYQDDWGGVNTSWGAVTASIYFPVVKKFSLGASYTFSSATTKGGKDASHLYYHTILFNGKYDYYRTGKLVLYGHLGLGVEITNFNPRFSDDYTKAYFGWQVSPLGVKGQLTNTFSLFAELGFGCQGLIQAGVNFTF